ncbi:MAG: hypothetical protein H6R24_1758 [Proteobacteria bacterium]|nr:hypothetical protein [Pseudomonadota bacterium]
MLSILLLGGGGLYWLGLIVGWRIAVLAGAGALGGALILLVGQGGIAPAAFPTVVLAAGLAGSLKWVHQPVLQAVGWPLYVLVVLALGFRLLPGFAPVPVLVTLGAGNPSMVWFSLVHSRKAAVAGAGAAAGPDAGDAGVGVVRPRPTPTDGCPDPGNHFAGADPPGAGAWFRATGVDGGIVAGSGLLAC